MKIRDGHVSNSSSSSYVLLTTKENYERALKEAHPYEAAVAEAIAKEVKFLGKDLVQLSEWSSPGGSMWDYMDDEIDFDGDKGKSVFDNEERCASDAFEAFQDVLGEGDDVIVLKTNW